MELTNEFRVDRPVDETWNVLTDVERIAPVLPGAQLQEIEGDEYRGIVKVKVGPDHRAVQGKGDLRREGRRQPQGGAARPKVATPRARATRRRSSRPRSTPMATGTKVKVHHRPHGHGQGGPVRPGHHGRREHQAAQPVRRAPRDHRARW